MKALPILAGIAVVAVAAVAVGKGSARAPMPATRVPISPPRAGSSRPSTRIGIGQGWAQPQPDGTWSPAWLSKPIWLADQDKDIQYHRDGQEQGLIVRAQPMSAAAADQWLAAMQAGPNGQVVWSDAIEQARIVDPPPKFQVGGGFYTCGEHTPGADPIKNLACGRFRKARKPIDLVVTERDGWYTALTKWGPLYTSMSQDETVAAGSSILERLNISGETEAIV